MKIDGGLRPLFRKYIPQAQWTTIESGMTSRGIPDSEYCFPNGISGWIEFKKTMAWSVNMRPEQCAWLTRRARLGGRALIAVRRLSLGGPRRDAADELWIVSGAYAVELKRGGLKALPSGAVLGCWWGGSGRWLWTGVTEVLKKGAPA